MTLRKPTTIRGRLQKVIVEYTYDLEKGWAFLINSTPTRTGVLSKRYDTLEQAAAASVAFIKRRI